MKPIIEVRNLSKIYQIGAKSERYLSLRDRLSSPSQWFSSNKTEPFYALKDVSFDIMPGETVGIIGRNGAGKSTLLKILSRITPPTSGSIKLRGRVASLLEVGTGFHPELTGRENIFFNGAILGMRKSEINRKLDEIIDFSGVEQFLDTPLKQYSSGMQLRLAFAVAAHLDPEILLIDEVLAVGDAEFQKKCLGKMEDISKGQGRTVVVVSHDMGMVERFCEKVLGLSKGQIVETSNNQFLEDTVFLNKFNNHNLFSCKELSLNKHIIIKSISLIEGSKFELFKSIRLMVSISSNIEVNVVFLIGISNQNNHRIISAFPNENQNVKIEKGEINLIIELPFENISLRNGCYNLTLGIKKLYDNEFDKLEIPNFFTVVENKVNYWGEIYSNLKIYKIIN